MASKCLEQKGGKGNLRKFIDRQNRICEAGLPSSQPTLTVKDNFEHYNLADAVEALKRDAFYTSFENCTKIHQKTSNTRDMRNAGIFGEGSELINPPVKTRFETLVEDFKNTAYNSYWNKEVGKIPDPVPSLPQGFKIYESTAGKKIKCVNSLYQTIMPVNAIVDMTPSSKEPGYQITRNYPSFHPNNTFGQKSNADRSGKLLKCCMNNDKSHLGMKLRVVINEKQAQYQDKNVAKIGEPLLPNKNIDNVPVGHSFGKIKPLDNYDNNSSEQLLRKCLEHLNTLRKCLAKRFDGTFFNKFYLNLKYLDNHKRGWLEKQVIYHQCNIRYIRIIPSLIEPLLHIWNSFNGLEIEYKMFIRIINHREPSPDLPKLQDVKLNFNDYRTTYAEMGNVQEFTNSNNRAGIPSGRYFDKNYPLISNGCKADEYYLPDETDMKTCLCPSIFTLLGINHRDMYARRDSAAIKRLFEDAGENFTDEKFKDIWKMAKKYHSQEWVCYETFRQALNEYEMKQKQTVV